jgi:hypothetical protein
MIAPRQAPPEEPPSGIRYTISAEEWPGKSPTYRDIANRNLLSPAQLAATLRANRGTSGPCADPEAPLPVGDTVIVALDATGGEKCLSAVVGRPLP